MAASINVHPPESSRSDTRYRYVAAVRSFGVKMSLIWLIFLARKPNYSATVGIFVPLQYNAHTLGGPPALPVRVADALSHLLFSYGIVRHDFLRIPWFGHGGTHHNWSIQKIAIPQQKSISSPNFYSFIILLRWIADQHVGRKSIQSVFWRSCFV